MHDLKWHLFVIRTQIMMRMYQLDLSLRLRTRVAAIVERVSDIPRLTAFVKRLEAKGKQLQPR